VVKAESFVFITYYKYVLGKASIELTCSNFSAHGRFGS